MRRLLLASALLLTSVASADSPRQDSGEIARIAGDFLSAEVRSRHPDVTRVEVTPVGPAPRVRVTGDGLLPRLPGNQRLTRRVCVRVDVMQGGRRVDSVPVWFALRTYRATLVALHPLRPKQPVLPGDVVQREHEVTLNDDALSEPAAVAGTRVKRYLRAGAVLHANNLEAVPAVLPDQQVAVHMVSGSFDIETTGVAEQEGRLGEMILVRNPSSGTSYHATVTSRNRVEVVSR
jgi:flagella basal body P-ring formation protein FlgA